MKNLLIIACFLFCASANSANIIYYENDQKTSFTIIQSNQVIFFSYDESDEELTFQLTSRTGFLFDITSKKEAMEVINKLFDVNNKEFIELKTS